MNESELKNTIQKAQRADALLNDPLIQEFIISLRGDLLNKFESTGLEDEAERLAAWNQSQVLNMFLDKFTKTIREGKNAQLSLVERAKIKLRNVI
ncbi:MAG: hypothetical protein MJK15_04070 [Colwellia sp.]|nr:hypothetical protein [Colwellia sp.]